MGSVAGFGAGSDLDFVARDIDEDLKEALNEFHLDKDELEKLDSDVEDSCLHCSVCHSSPVGSETEIYSDGGEQDALDSDDDMPKKDVLDKLTRLASQFTRTVEKLRNKAHIPSKASFSSDLSHRSDPSSRLTPPMDSEELIPCTQADDDEEFEKDSVCSSHTTRKKLIAPWRSISEKCVFLVRKKSRSPSLPNMPCMI